MQEIAGFMDLMSIIVARFLMNILLELSRSVQEDSILKKSMTKGLSREHLLLQSRRMKWRKKECRHILDLCNSQRNKFQSPYSTIYFPKYGESGILSI